MNPTISIPSSDTRQQCFLSFAEDWPFSWTVTYQTGSSRSFKSVYVQLGEAYSIGKESGKSVPFPSLLLSYAALMPLSCQAAL